MAPPELEGRWVTPISPLPKKPAKGVLQIGGVSQKCYQSSSTDMEFVQNFTPPDFQAKNFTPSISPNFNSFSKKKHKKMSENGEIYTRWQKFYTAAGMDKFHLCGPSQNISAGVFWWNVLNWLHHPLDGKFLLEGIFHLARTKQEIDDLQRVLSEQLQNMVILKFVSVHSEEEVEVVPTLPRNLQQDWVTLIL